MSEVAREAGVGRATLHRHFPTKAHLVNSIGVRCIEEMNAAVLADDDEERPAIERLRLMLRAAIPIGDRYAFLGYVTFTDKLVSEKYDQQLAWAWTLVQSLKNEEVIAQDTPSRWVVAQLDQQIWTAWMAVSEWGFDPNDAITLAFNTLMQGLSKKSLN